MVRLTSLTADGAGGASCPQRSLRVLASRLPLLRPISAPEERVKMEVEILTELRRNRLKAQEVREGQQQVVVRATSWSDWAFVTPECGLMSAHRASHQTSHVQLSRWCR